MFGVAFGREVVVIVTGGTPAIVMLSCSVAVSGVVFPESVTWKVKFVVPTLDSYGEPEMSPEPEKFMLNGTVPLITFHVYGAIPPLALSVCE